MVLEWPVLPLPTPHTCSSWGIAIVSIKTTSILDLGPRMLLLFHCVSRGQSLRLGAPKCFLPSEVALSSPLPLGGRSGCPGEGPQVLFRGFIGHGGGEHDGGYEDRGLY